MYRMYLKNLMTP